MSKQDSFQQTNEILRILREGGILDSPIIKVDGNEPPIMMILIAICICRTSNS